MIIKKQQKKKTKKTIKIKAEKRPERRRNIHKKNPFPLFTKI